MILTTSFRIRFVFSAACVVSCSGRKSLLQYAHGIDYKILVLLDHWAYSELVWKYKFAEAVDGRRRQCCSTEQTRLNRVCYFRSFDAFLASRGSSFGIRFSLQLVLCRVAAVKVYSYIIMVQIIYFLVLCLLVSLSALEKSLKKGPSTKNLK